VHRPVETSDGWIFVSPVAGRHISAALTALGLEDRKPELLAITDPTELADAFCVLTESRTRTKPSAHWLSVLTAHGVPVSPVLDLDQHLADPQVVHNEVYRVVEHPELGSVRAPHHPAAPDGAIGPSPALGDRAERIT
jgi:crotonobetainyl-CoA:carnitine CoA-transferase CaiB-like acyl-CoA transferase